MKKVKELVCAYCGRDIDFTVDGQWVHDDGNVYAYECANCGWLGATAPAENICPNCGLKLILSHYAYPDLLYKGWEWEKP